MNTALWIAGLCAAVSGLGSVSGQVVDESGAGIAEAAVLLEPGLTGALVPVTADGTGHFMFEEVVPGPVGIVALAPGRALGGCHVNLAENQRAEGLVVTLRKPGTLSGRVVNERGKPVLGASITRIALLGADKVGLPLEKLTKFGVSLPVSGAEGQFSIPDLPAGESVAIKAVHGGYAPAILSPVDVGTADVLITLDPGVQIDGRVETRDHNLAVSGASVYVRNADPPHDTQVVESDMTGSFALRLRPGRYLCRAQGMRVQSPGWDSLAVANGETVKVIKVLVADMGEVRGSLRDAVTEAPIEGARVSLSSHGKLSSVVRTGPGGEFVFQAAEGDALIQLEAVPGYLPGESGALRLDVKPRETIELPGLWLAPIPDFPLQVIGTDGAPSAGALVSVVEPAQFGWLAANDSGQVTVRVGSWPKGGGIVGWAESRDGGAGAVFLLERSHASGVSVQLMPLARVFGQTVNERGRGAEGVPVAGVVAPDTLAEPVVLWRILSGPDGRFSWPATAPGVPQKCLVRAGPAELSASAIFNLEPGASLDLGKLNAGQGPRGKSMTGKRFDWRGLRHLAGPEAPSGGPSLLVCVEGGEALAAVESLAAAKSVLEGLGITPVAVVNGSFDGAAEIPVLSGKAPSGAKVYTTDASGKVRYETFGLPPLCLLAECAK